MARRRYRHYRRNTIEDLFLDLLKPLVGILIIVLLGYGITHQEEIKFYGAIAVMVIVVGSVAYIILKRRHKRDLNLRLMSDENILYMLKGMTPSRFESEVANMFDLLGYRTEVTGGANDGGIDVIAHKDGKRYFIQCKKFITREVTPHDVRDFLGAITNINNPAAKGFFITTNGFTLMAEKAAEGNPRIELIDGIRLVQYYKKAHGDTMPEQQASALAQLQDVKMCPQCGGRLTPRTAQHGEFSGKQFWGCSNFPKCKYIENIE